MCRQALAAHIGTVAIPGIVQDRDRLCETMLTLPAHAVHITVLPEEVRLIPRPDDGYEWHYPPEKHYLFHKHLSKHNLGACRELCREVGHTFRAVARGDGAGMRPGSAHDKHEVGAPPPG